MVQTATTIELTEDEIWRVIDSNAHERRGVSGEELLRQYDSGELVDPGDVADLIVLADLLPERQSR